MFGQSETEDMDKAEDRNLCAKRAVGWFRINLQTEGGAASEINRRDFKQTKYDIGSQGSQEQQGCRRRG